MKDQGDSFSGSLPSIFKFWLQILKELRNPFPILNIDDVSPVGCVEVTTDAAGCGDGYLRDHAGVGAALNNFGDIPWCGQYIFPDILLESMVDKDGKRFGAKSTMLETAAIFLPLFHLTKKLLNKNLLILTDNLGTHIFYTFSGNWYIAM